MATKPQQGATQAAAGSGGGKVFKPALLLVLLLSVAALMAPTAILLVASLAPTMVARLLDPTRGSYLTWTVFGMNVVGSLYFLHELWSLGDDFSSLMIVIADPIGWLAAMAGAGFGWVLYLAMPMAAARIAASQSALRMRRVTRDLQQLTDEWGPGVAEKDE
ncbi:MAG TPA: hypothetical protein VG742_01660 [Dongiaceae bacterium]|nr:hypothetical protein [Dongiaceae bacterium]